jgi:hypothetical protein
MYAMVLSLSGLMCAFSSRPPTKLTPKNIADQPHLLCVGTEKNGDEMRFTVLVRLKAGKSKPIVEGGYLHVNDGESFVAGCGVPPEDHPEAERNIVRFVFAVSPKYLETSTFGFSVATLDERGLKAAPAGVGWQRYEFTLRDFPVGITPEFGVYPRESK